MPTYKVETYRAVNRPGLNEVVLNVINSSTGSHVDDNQNFA
ncbi:MAG: hypothetical protein WEA99_10755 [Brumimicrobium sp.]